MENVLAKVPVNVNIVGDARKELHVVEADTYNSIKELEDHGRLDKLIGLLDTIEFIETARDGSVRIMFKSNVITEARGNIIRHTKDGLIVDKANTVHIQPVVTDETMTNTTINLLKHIKANIEYKE